MRDIVSLQHCGIQLHDECLVIRAAIAGSDDMVDVGVQPRHGHCSSAPLDPRRGRRKRLLHMKRGISYRQVLLRSVLPCAVTLLYTAV